jgi:polyhydroxyalkanoate synthesis regulator phasin
MERLKELIDRMVAPGPAFAQLSASEGHEIRDEVLGLIQANKNAKRTLEHVKDQMEEIAYQERERCVSAVEAEEEYPGRMPDEMWEAIRGDRDAMEAALRITVKLTKDGIKSRILAA